MILITGGAGFIGSHLTRELVRRRYKVRVLDNLFRSDLSEIEDLIESKKIEFIKGDIRNKREVEKAMKGVKYVFHLAAVCINYSIKYPEKSIEVNLQGSNNVLQSALKNNVKRVIFSSSASVYGNAKLPMKENGELNPITPYCISKLATEQLLKFYSRYGLKYNILRYFNVYGPGQKVDAYYTSVISAFIKKLINKEHPIIQGEGKQTMDFVHVKDVTQANLLAMITKKYNEIYNVGTGKQTSIKELAEIISKALDSNIKLICDGKKTLVQKRQADISKIKKIGFKVTIFIEEGLSLNVNL